MSAVAAALIGAVGIWLVLAVLALFTWMETEHPWVLGALFLTPFGAVIGLAVHDGAIG